MPFILLFLVQFVSGQTLGEKQITGIIIVDAVAVEGVTITNVRNEKATVSDIKGVFNLVVKVGDVLLLSAVNLETRRKTISEDDFNSELLIFKMNPKMNQLKEVTINQNSNINAENLGIIPYGQKKYTPAERKLYTATTGGGIVPLDPIINWISGRTTMLKKEIIVEKNEKLLMRLDGYYEEDYYTEVLKIPKNYIKGFQYYLIEDADFANALRAKNKTMTLFLVKKLASGYNEIIQREQK
ncbi:hypothetical protein DB895_03615 [Flavobacterium psychrotolerans]|uniref:Carboxypeptidase-like regulatory domain-containing protein n=1 Tax=Flavobacterium psychrotolerans TaxID=2169410 RepID=A0A2U1JNR5_9FLAO|nr:hypothetical protein DB895_03615 [Flavobacterium psychrotolerans]